MQTQAELEERIQNLEKENREIKTMLAQITNGGGAVTAIGGTVSDSTFIGRWRDFLRHGKHAQEGFKVNKLCLAFGPEEGATGIDQVQKTGQVDQVLGNDGHFHSGWDSA